MKNNYEVRGSVTAIFIDRKNGSILEALIDTADLPKVLQSRRKWCAQWSEPSKTFYVKAHTETSTHYLHRWITDAVKGVLIDHKNHSGLDCRRENLRRGSHTANLLNRRGATSANKSGLRGVSLHPGRPKPYHARVQYQGKQMSLGYFGTANDAHEAARAKYEELLRLEYPA